MSEDRRPGAGRASWAAAMALVALVALVFGRTVAHDLLAWDDRFHISENPRLFAEGVTGWVDLLTRPYIGLFAPASYAWFRLELAVTAALGMPASIEDVAPAVFRAGSLVLHAVNSVLVFALLRRRLSFGVGAAFAGAALFAVHPVQVEAVAWTSEQRGLLAAAFALGAMLVAPWGTSGPAAARAAVRYAAASVLFALALLSKPSAAVVPALVVALAWYADGGRWRRAAALMLPWLLAAAGLLVWTKLLQPATSAGPAPAWWLRPVVAADAAGTAIRWVGAPWPLTPDHGRTPAAVLAAGPWNALWLIALGAIAAAVRGGARRAVLAGAAVLLLAVAPTLGLVPFEHQWISTVAERYLYLGMLGPALLAAWLVGRSPAHARWARPAIACALGVMAGLSCAHAAVWRDDATLFAHARAVRPDSVLAANNLGDAALRSGDAERAAHLFAAALDNAGAAPFTPAIRANLADALLALGDVAGARREIDRALERSPRDPRSWLISARVARAAGDDDRALSAAAESASLRPWDPDAAALEGRLALEAGDAARAVRALERSAALRRDGVTLWLLGRARARAGDAERAVAAWRSAIDAGAPEAAVRSDLGTLHARSGAHAEALAEFERVVELGDAGAESWYRLGLARAVTGDRAGAGRAFERALALDPGHAGAAGALEAVGGGLE